MIAACEESKTKLMIAYRLHFGMMALQKCFFAFHLFGQASRVLITLLQDGESLFGRHADSAVEPDHLAVQHGILNDLAGQ